MSAEGKTLIRSDDRMLAGVCAGLAEYMNVDITAMRVAVALGTLLSGGFPVITAYVVMAFILPESHEVAAAELDA